MKGFYHYRFLLLDFVHVMRENPNIRAHYLEMEQRRKVQFDQLFQLLIKNEIMREEALPNEYKLLYKRFEIIGNFWMSSAQIENDSLSPNHIDEYSLVMHQAIYPYLTQKGKEEYVRLFSV